MSAISSLSSFLQNMTLVQNSQNNIAKLTYQVDTGLKSQDLQGYGTQANQLLNLQSGQTTEQNYVSNNTQTSTYLSAYDSTMGQIKSDASKLSASLDAFTVTDPTTVSNLQALVKALQVDVSATLNTQIGGRYLYGGTRYTTAPVGDLSALPAPTFVTPATTPPTVTPLTVALLPAPVPQTTPTATPALPPYDAQASTVNSPATPTAAELATATQSYATQTTAIADNQTTTYGISSNNPTFQHLIYALQNAQAAASTNTSTQAGLDNQAALIKQATSEIAIALNGGPAVAASAGPPAVSAVAAVDSLQSLQDQNSTALLAVSSANTVHSQTLATLQSQITTITQVDPATVAAELSAAQTQLQGSYKVVSSVLNDTLLNYLK
jgi:flagellar hook-associated protein 3 FlgL